MADPRELAEQAFALHENAPRDSEARAEDAGAQLKSEDASSAPGEKSAEVLTHRLQDAEAEIARLQQTVARLEEVAAAERLKAAQLRKKLEIAESGPESLTKKEINFWRAKAEGIDATVKEYKMRIALLRKELMERDALLEKLQEPPSISQSHEQLREIDALRAELNARNETLAARDAHIVEISAALEQTRTTLERNERELLTQRDTLAGTQLELDAVRAENLRLTSEIDTVRQQVTALEAELNEEKEHAENLVELANERREQIRKLQEQVEEANERYEEAKWRLSKALYFERLVRRRKGLINKLIAALRAKMRANTALKAGLDGLRTYKAAAEINQQKLLSRIESLKTELQEAQEAIARHHSSAMANEQIAEREARLAELEERLNTQAELIQSLEADLKVARAMAKVQDRSFEIDRLQKEIAAKNQVIAQLQQDLDEQQRKLAKVRTAESETARLRAISDQERLAREALEREVAELREVLERQTAPIARSGATPEQLEAMVKERDAALQRLSATIKEHEATIRKLSEAADGWKRKYQFLVSDSPEAKAAGEN